MTIKLRMTKQGFASLKFCTFKYSYFLKVNTFKIYSAIKFYLKKTYRPNSAPLKINFTGEYYPA